MYALPSQQMLLVHNTINMAGMFRDIPQLDLKVALEIAAAAARLDDLGAFADEVQPPGLHLVPEIKVERSIVVQNVRIA